MVLDYLSVRLTALCTVGTTMYNSQLCTQLGSTLCSTQLGAPFSSVDGQGKCTTHKLSSQLGQLGALQLDAWFSPADDGDTSSLNILGSCILTLI